MNPKLLTFALLLLLARYAGAEENKNSQIEIQTDTSSWNSIELKTEKPEWWSIVTSTPIDTSMNSDNIEFATSWSISIKTDCSEIKIDEDNLGEASRNLFNGDSILTKKRFIYSDPFYCKIYKATIFYIDRTYGKNNWNEKEMPNCGCKEGEI